MMIQEFWGVKTCLLMVTDFSEEDTVQERSLVIYSITGYLPDSQR
jgi:hypothetical protein